ncbi:MAG: two-component sensor histidine kinase [Rhodoferax sp.]|nr:two-component sensor histidine kinase [Rhodoferax sp.]
MSQSPDAAQQRIDALQLELQLARDALEDFTHSVSHDLRAPVRHINAYLKIIREDLGEWVEPEIASHLQTVADSAALIVRQLDALQELSRIARVELQLADVDLSRLLIGVQVQLAAEHADRPVQWRIQASLPLVRGDQALLGQMLTQLLGNSLKFSAASAPAVIEVSGSPCDDEMLELRISDNGVGFDSRFQDQLFRVFQRLHSSRQFAGLGTGLAFSRRVAERHGGSISVRGDLAPGCCVTLRLPLAAALSQ